jgi:hypothetical protein
MSTLLLQIRGEPLYNLTIFPPYLYLYDDILAYRKRRFIVVDEVTLSYSHIVQVNLARGIFFSTLEIINTGVQNIKIKYIFTGQAVKAKKLIDQKIYFSLAKEKPKDNPEYAAELHNYEKSLNRLKELLSQEKITEREFEEKRKKLLKRVG